jgi:hypothetical protein
MRVVLVDVRADALRLLLRGFAGQGGSDDGRR